MVSTSVSMPQYQARLLLQLLTCATDSCQSVFDMQDTAELVTLAVDAADRGTVHTIPLERSAYNVLCDARDHLKKQLSNSK